MRRLTLLAAVLLTACGEGADPSAGDNVDNDDAQQLAPQTFAGQLVGVGAGVRYTTQSRGGVTDASGTFVYARDEDVKFSIGDTLLGSAKARERITLFDLFFMTPPATEDELIAALTDQRSDFHRVVNIMSMLAALDQDGDLGNGIDIGSSSAALSGHSLALGTTLSYFPDNWLIPFAQRKQIPVSVVPFTEVVAYLYGTLGITIPAHVPTQDVWRQGVDAAINYIYTNTYDAVGRLIGSEADNQGDGTIEYRSTQTYDANGRLVAGRGDSTWPDYTGWSTYAITYDARGRRLSRTDESSIRGTTTQCSILDTRDGVGRLTLRAERCSNGSETTRSSDDNVTYASDAITHRIVSNNEGVVQLADDRVAYDALGRYASYEASTDDGGDAIIDYTAKSTFSYDERDRLIDRLQEAKPSTFGSTTTRWVLDARGLAVSSVEESDLDFDGQLDRRTTTSYSYDGSGRMIASRAETDDGPDGTVDSTWACNTMRDALGNPVSNRCTRSSATQITLTMLRESVYEGRVLIETQERSDRDGDGVFDDFFGYSYTTTVIADGIRYLVGRYAL